MRDIFIGTSGWSYNHWKGLFYPKDLPNNKWLNYYSQNFKTTEINYSFYQLPRPKTYQRWHRETPKDFLFSLKANRFITHISLAGKKKNINQAKEIWQEFFQNSNLLKEKLALILFQFPPSFHFNKKSAKKLEDFFSWLKRDLAKEKRNLKCAFEFRDESWANHLVYDFLKKNNFAWAIADSSRYFKKEVITADFVYIRMHGPGDLFSSSYSKKDLKIWAQKIKKWSKKLSVFVYFNNDFKGFALKNAKELINLLNLPKNEKK